MRSAVYLFELETLYYRKRMVCQMAQNEYICGVFDWARDSIILKADGLPNGKMVCQMVITNI